ncbi:hypothetical protein F4779DRAFT_615602 [Xylariaceae sp. FL0662B]|nr:hypothetical protein F4779DRAFT_615602 [Xylariaceae sp. FL0662B]
MIRILSPETIYFDFGVEEKPYNLFSDIDNRGKQSCWDLPSVGLEDPFVGLGGFPDLDGPLGAFDVFDYWDAGEVDVGGDEVDGAGSGVDPEPAGEGLPGELEPEWFGLPMPGQFPISSWLADKLNTARSGDDSYYPLNRYTEPQYSPFGNLNLSLPLSFNDAGAGPAATAVEQQETLIPGIRMNNVTPAVSNQPEFKCDPCGLSFPSRGKLNQHNRRHEKRQRCPECAQRFTEPRDLRRHVEARHQAQQLSVQCPRCGKSLKKRKDNLQRHVTRYCKGKHNHSRGSS